MEIAAVVEIVKTVGLSGVFMFGCIYLYRSQEAKEKRIAAEVKDREQRLGKRLDSTEEYIRTTQAAQIDRSTAALNANTAATNALATAMENLQRAVMNGQYHEKRTTEP